MNLELYRLICADETGLHVPPTLAKLLRDFSSGRKATQLQGKRETVYIEGQLSKDWKNRISNNAEQEEVYDYFIKAVGVVILKEAWRMYPYAKAIAMSKDMVAIIGGKEMQATHVDLKYNQVQALVPLTHSLSTLIYCGPSPSVDEAFENLEMNPISNSMEANLLRTTPALSLSRDEILRQMKHVTSVGLQSTEAPLKQRKTGHNLRSETTKYLPSTADYWKEGTLFLAAESVMHAGPEDK